jgi:hypothetical protein
VAQRLDRIERIGEAVPTSGLRHELSDARSALWAHSTGIETAFLPDDASEKFDGEAVLCGGLLQCPTNVVCSSRIDAPGLRFDWRNRLIGVVVKRCWGGGTRLRIRLRA